MFHLNVVINISAELQLIVIRLKGEISLVITFACPILTRLCADLLRGKTHKHGGGDC